MENTINNIIREETNFFSLLQEMNVSGTLTIVVKPLESNNMAVSILLTNPDKSENQNKRIQPLLFKGPSSIIDKNFFSKISEPIKDTDELLMNIDEYVQNIKIVKENKKSKPVSKKEEITHEEKQDITLLYTETMGTVLELEKQMKYQEALDTLPIERDFPINASEIQKKRKELETKRTLLTLL